MSFPLQSSYLQLGIFRLQDECVRIQEGMENFIRTAALEKVPQIEAIFRWLRKRNIQIALISDQDRPTTEILLERLNWRVGEEELLQFVLTNQHQKDNPVADVIELAGLPDGRLVFSLFDTPRLLLAARESNVHLSLGVTNGLYGYAKLSTVPHHGLLDGPIQLPNYLLEQVSPHSGLPQVRGKQGNGFRLNGGQWPSMGLLW